MKNAVPSEKIGTGAAFFSPNAWTHRKNVSSSVASLPSGGVFLSIPGRQRAVGYDIVELGPGKK